MAQKEHDEEQDDSEDSEDECEQTLPNASDSHHQLRSAQLCQFPLRPQVNIVDMKREDFK